MNAPQIILADRKGRRFYAIVTGKGQRELNVEPIDRRVTYHQVKAREVAREQALTLARVLLGYTGEELNGAARWSCPIAGGRRTVALVQAGGERKSGVI